MNTCDGSISGSSIDSIVVVLLVLPFHGLSRPQGFPEALPSQGLLSWAFLKPVHPGLRHSEFKGKPLKLRAFQCASFRKEVRCPSKTILLVWTDIVEAEIRPEPLSIGRRSGGFRILHQSTTPIGPTRGPLKCVVAAVESQAELALCPKPFQFSEAMCNTRKNGVTGS